jgi:hypothetical protein
MLRSLKKRDRQPPFGAGPLADFAKKARPSQERLEAIWAILGK